MSQHSSSLVHECESSYARLSSREMLCSAYLQESSSSSFQSKAAQAKIYVDWIFCIFASHTSWIRVELTNNLKKFTSHELLICEMLFHVYKVVSDHFQADSHPVFPFLLSVIFYSFCHFQQFLYWLILSTTLLERALYFSFWRKFSYIFFAFQHQTNAGKCGLHYWYFFLLSLLLREKKWMCTGIWPQHWAAFI